MGKPSPPLPLAKCQFNDSWPRKQATVCSLDQAQTKGRPEFERPLRGKPWSEGYSQYANAQPPPVEAGER